MIYHWLYKKKYQCTLLENFPTQIEHCIEFGKLYFAELFEKNIGDLNYCINDVGTYFKKLDNLYTSKKLYLESLEETENLLLLFYKKNEINLIKFGLKKFYKFFYKNTSDLLKNNQKDTVDERGQPFRRGNKIMQHHIDFKEQDELS